MTELQQIEKTNLRFQARAAIRAQIVTGGLRPGDIYPVNYFSAQLGVSATPAREALLDLANEGLIELVRNRGFRIVELSDRDLDEILEIRLLLEVPAIRKAAGCLDPEEISACLRLAELAEESVAKGDLSGFVSADRDFHLRMMAPANNGRLIELIGQLRDQARLPGLQSAARTVSLAIAGEEHRSILRAVASGDADVAERLLRDHLAHTRAEWAGKPASSTNDGDH